jgi:hypothetical protein
MIRLSLAVLLLLAACARDASDYPSLATRAGEGRGFAEPAVTPPPLATADPALDAKLAPLTQRLAAIAAGYTADARLAEAAADLTGARTVGSENWIAAQTALAALDDWRAQTGGLATELDELARERIAAAGAPYPALEALRARVSTESERQATGIAAVSARLPTP